MTPATAVVAPVRLVLAALVAALAAFAAATFAPSAESATSVALAPAGSCSAADDRRAAPSVQARAILCLVNVARRQQGQPALAAPPKLRLASALKGRTVASCKQFSHTPCGKDATAAVRASGYRFGWWGENLFVGPWGQVSARDVVAGWLGSPLHRANVLRPGFRHLGVARVHVSGSFVGGDAAVWVATFASPR